MVPRKRGFLDGDRHHIESHRHELETGGGTEGITDRCCDWTDFLHSFGLMGESAGWAAMG